MLMVFLSGIEISSDQSEPLMDDPRASGGYGVLEGEVVAISPDTHQGSTGQPYYKVSIATDKTYFGNRKMRYMLSPGLLLQVSIQTGSRTVLQYIFGPLMSGSRQAMTER